MRNRDLVALNAFFSPENGIGWIIPPIWLISLSIILVFSRKYSNSFPKNKADNIQEAIIEISIKDLKPIYFSVVQKKHTYRLSVQKLNSELM